MIAFSALPHVRSIELPNGKLAVHEEFPDTVAEAMRSFLDEMALGSQSNSGAEVAVDRTNRSPQRHRMQVFGEDKHQNSR